MLSLIHVSSRCFVPSHLVFIPSQLSNYYLGIEESPIHKLSFEIAGNRMSFETGKIGRQASGAVVATMNDTIVYSTVCIEREAKPCDFTPLRVDWFARFSAVGQTVGAFHRRDSRGDDTEILVARLIDRPIRPMIAEGWQHETQILTWVLSYDRRLPPDALSICSASAAMCISQVPFAKPVAGVEVGMIDGNLKVNPTKQEMENSTLHLTIAGTKEGILMIEGAAEFLPEEIMFQALKLGHEAIGEICDAIQAFADLVKPEKKTDTLRKLPVSLVDNIDSAFGEELEVALNIGDKHKRGFAVAQVEKKITSTFCADALDVNTVTDHVSNGDTVADSETKDAGAPLLPSDEEDEIDTTVEPADDDSEMEDEASEIKLLIKKDVPSSSKEQDPIDVKIAIKKLLVRRLRKMIIQKGRRSDGRGVEDVRPIDIHTNFLPGAHGSTLFTRGETQSLATATLGSKAMEARFENLDEDGTKRFYLQYRFPPSSVGEVGKVGAVNRREVGHGNLAERALIPAIPSMRDFPYAIRAESLITESCGSSSMATVCGCCLAMLDAGVPLKKSIAGVAMGLILGENPTDEPVILTDILGLEDALGTMDFKIAGDDEGITTFQLDIKSEGLTLDTLEKALQQAKRGKLHILGKMNSILNSPQEMKDTVPKMMVIQVPPEIIGKIIGPKGKTIQELIANNGVININLEDDGTVQIESYTMDSIENCKAAIMKIVEEGDGKGAKSGKKEPEGPPPEIGVIYRDCEVKGVHNFGVFVEILPGYEGLVHVSELDIKKIPNPAAAGIEAGQKLDVKYLGKNEKGQMRLSRRQVLLRDAGGGDGNENATKSSPSVTSATTSTAAAEDAYSS